MPRTPAPFSRPSITLGGRTQRRTWLNVRAKSLQINDMVADVGTIKEIEWRDVDGVTMMVLINRLGAETIVSPEETFNAFVVE